MSVQSWYASSLPSPEFVGLANFRRAFVDDERFRNALWLTLYFTGLATALQLALGVALALLLNRPFRGKGLMRCVFPLPMVATPVAIALVWMMMYNPTLGVMNYLVGLVGLGPYRWVSNAAIVVPALAVEVKIFKPSPRGYHLAADHFGLRPTEVGFVSSNGRDVAGAASAGLETFWIQRRATEPPEELGFTADHTVRTITDLPALLGG